MWPKKAKKSQMSFGLFSKIKKTKRVEKRSKITNLASKKPNWQPCLSKVGYFSLTREGNNGTIALSQKNSVVDTTQ